MTLEDQLTATPDGRRLWQQERNILEVTESICRLMRREDVTRGELAKRLGWSKGTVSRFLGGQVKGDIRSISDVFTALGYQIQITAVKIGVGR